jgi:hypothetical protein
MSAHQLVVSARTQAAIVRALVDEFDHTTADGSAEPWMQAQLIEELARLGCRIMDLAAALTVSCPPEPVPESKTPYSVVGGAL